jgi:hypothetical protein
MSHRLREAMRMLDHDIFGPLGEEGKVVEADETGRFCASTYIVTFYRPSYIEMTMASERTIAASEFKAKCLDLLDQLASRKLTRLCVTKRGRIVAVVTPPDDIREVEHLHGFLRGSVLAPDGFDFTAPALDEPLSADRGNIHE